MECPSCGSRVSKKAVTCALCGEALQPGLTSILPRSATVTAKIEREEVSEAIAGSGIVQIARSSALATSGTLAS